MKFQCSAVFWMLLTASASSFATTKSNHRTNSLSNQGSTVPIISQDRQSRLPFVPCRGGASTSSSSSITQLSASVESQIFVTSENLAILSDRGRQAVLNLIENDTNEYQKHVYSNWPPVGTQDDDKRRLAEQVSYITFMGGWVRLSARNPQSFAWCSLLP